MRLLVFILIALGASCNCLDVGIKSQDVIFNRDYLVHIDYNPDNQTVTFDLTVRTKGFVGFGVSQNGGMDGADIVIGGVTDGGQIYFQDYHGLGPQSPVLDIQQDYTLLSASENGTHTFLTFSRILATCDPNDVAITMDTQKLIWAVGSTDTIQYHDGTRGTHSVNILDPKPPMDVSQFEEWDMVMVNTIPAIETSYWCTIHKTPGELQGPHHVVGFDIILPSELALKHIHHTDIYECEAAPDQTVDETFADWIGDDGVDCYNGTLKPDFPNRYCTRIQYGWAVGGQPIFFPNHTAFPFPPNKYYMMERHFDNPKALPGQTFESGMRLYYSNGSREFDAGVVLAGATIKYTQMIPPNSVNFTQTCHCSAECTELFPEDGVNVFAILLHAHTAGKAMKVRLFRGGVELPWIYYDAKFDFNYQQYRPLLEEFKLFRGDHITVECLYDTTWKKGETTIGGRSTRDEMCTANFLIYPRMEHFLDCQSHYPEEGLLEFLGIQEMELGPDGEEDPTIKSPMELKGMKFTKMIEDNITWTQDLRERYQEMHRFGMHNAACFPANPNVPKTTYPKVPEEYWPKDVCAKEETSSLPYQPIDENNSAFKLAPSLIFSFCFGILMWM